MPTTITGADGVSQVQAGAVESSDLPAEAYQKNNILGTVSESSGVPAGAIIERGSNANGEFVKYADGTVICTNSISFTSGNNGSASISLPITLTVFFSCSAICFANDFGQSTNSYSLFSLQTSRGSSNVSSINFRIGNPSTGSRVGNKLVQNLTITAIGTWF